MDSENHQRFKEPSCSEEREADFSIFSTSFNLFHQSFLSLCSKPMTKASKGKAMPKHADIPRGINHGGYTMADIPWQICHGRYTMVHIPQQIYHGGYSTEDIPWRIYHGRYTTADIPRWIYHSRYTTADITQRIYHGQYTMADIPWRWARPLGIAPTAVRWITRMRCGTLNCLLSSYPSLKRA